MDADKIRQGDWVQHYDGTKKISDPITSTSKFFERVVTTRPAEIERDIVTCCGPHVVLELENKKEVLWFGKKKLNVLRHVSYLS